MWLDDDGEDRAVFWQLPCLQGPCYASSMGRAPRGALVRPIRSWFESRRSARPRPRPARRETEMTGGELAVVDQGGGVLVHAHGDHGVGVAKPPCYSTNGDLLGEQPDGVGVAQVVEARPLLVGPCLVQPGVGEG